VRVCDDAGQLLNFWQWLAKVLNRVHMRTYTAPKRLSNIWQCSTKLKVLLNMYRRWPGIECEHISETFLSSQNTASPKCLKVILNLQKFCEKCAYTLRVRMHGCAIRSHGNKNFLSAVPGESEHSRRLPGPFRLRGPAGGALSWYPLLMLR